jgi:hypothetical protein
MRPRRPLPRPWRSEADAFSTLLYLLVLVAVIVAIVLIVRAVS